jgi:hypothetical protein
VIHYQHIALTYVLNAPYGPGQVLRGINVGLRSACHSFLYVAIR